MYFAPNPGTLAWLAGSHWLGRCAALLQPMQPLDIHGVAREELERLTAAPRRYGWHATLKAPFALAPGVDWLTLHHTVQTLAQGLRPFSMPPMQVERIGDFLALVPAAAHPANAEIQAAAAACVTQLQPLAAALSKGTWRAAAPPGSHPGRMHCCSSGATPSCWRSSASTCR